MHLFFSVKICWWAFKKRTQLFHIKWWIYILIYEKAPLNNFGTFFFCTKICWWALKKRTQLFHNNWWSQGGAIDCMLPLDRRGKKMSHTYVHSFKCRTVIKEALCCSYVNIAWNISWIQSCTEELAPELIEFQMEQMFTKPMDPRELLIHLLWKV